MSRQHHVIYIPGLGDHNPHGQVQIIKKWLFYGLHAHYVPVGWAEKGDFKPRLQRILKIVDELVAKDYIVSLVGVSAGAGAALNVYMERPDKITAVVYVCGKIVGADNVGQHYFRNNPPFHSSLLLTQKNLTKLTKADKDKMLSLHAIYDNVVPVPTSRIAGVRNRTVPAIFHIPAIFLTITVYRNMIIGFLKRRAREL